MTEFLLQWWADALCGLLFAGLGIFCGMLWQKFHGVTGGVKSLLGYRIKRECEKYITKGSCPTYIKDDIEEMYVSYKKLRGNGTAEALWKRLLELPPA